MTYTGNPAVNMSSFLETLNTVQDPTDMSNFDFGGDDNLALFSDVNTFFDYDQGRNTDLATFDINTQSSGANVGPETKQMDFMNADFTVPEFNFQQMNQHPATYPAPGPQLQESMAVYPSSVASGTSSPQNGLASAPRTGEKRKASESVETPYAGSGDSESRDAAEEDKRRRNTAASARFRVKKKQREQALEKEHKEMADKMSALQNKINQLETENKWLKSLVIEKKENKSEQDIQEMIQKFQSESEAATRLDGVGTAAKIAA